jgi:hypothetical protein
LYVYGSEHRHGPSVLRECAKDYGDPEKKQALAAADALLTPDFAMHYNNEAT